jgi:DNA uptake protein ComE-like DNA-binding protein
MNERAQSVALLLISAVMLVVVGVVMVARPVHLSDVKATEPIIYRIKINSADRDTLSLLPGIAQGKAQRIVDNRQVHGIFIDADDLTRVPLIGDKTAAAMQPWVQFGSNP